MKILLTGNRGLVGSEVQKQLEEAGHEVIGLDIADGYDITCADMVIKAARNCRAVVHLAALMDDGENDTDEIMRINVLGTWNVLQAAAASGVHRVIYMSSADALGIFKGEGVPEYLPLDGDHPCRPRTPYAISKKLAEDMCRYFCESTGITTICLRPPEVWDCDTYERVKEARKFNPEYEWKPYWEYGAFIDVRDLSNAIKQCLDTSRLAGFHCLLVSADDITTSGRSSIDLVRKLHPDVQWKGGGIYEVDPYASLVVNDDAKRLLGWTPKYSWKNYEDNCK